MFFWSIFTAILVAISNAFGVFNFAPTPDSGASLGEALGAIFDGVLGLVNDAGL